MKNKQQLEMKKEAEVEVEKFSNVFLFVLLKVLIVLSIGQNLMIIFIFYHKFLLNKNVFFFFNSLNKETREVTFLLMKIFHTWYDSLQWKMSISQTYHFCIETISSYNFNLKN